MITVVEAQIAATIRRRKSHHGVPAKAATIQAARRSRSSAGTGTSDSSPCHENQTPTCVISIGSALKSRLIIAELANGLPLASGQRREITIGEARLLIRRWIPSERSYAVIDAIAEAYLARHNEGTSANDERPRFPHVTVQLSGYGDVFALINRVCRALREAGVSLDDIEIYRNVSMKSSDYGTVLRLTRQTVTVKE